MLLNIYNITAHEKVMSAILLNDHHIIQNRSDIEILILTTRLQNFEVQKSSWSTFYQRLPKFSPPMTALGKSVIMLSPNIKKYPLINSYVPFDPSLTSLLVSMVSTC